LETKAQLLTNLCYQEEGKLPVTLKRGLIGMIIVYKLTKRCL